MSLVENQMIAHEKTSSEHNNTIAISTQVNVNETTNAVKTIAISNQQQQQLSTNCRNSTYNTAARHLTDDDELNSDIPENSYCTFTEPRRVPIITFSCLLKLVFSTPGLVVLVVIYSIMGALIFPMLEVPQDIRQSVDIVKSRDECLRELWSITEKLNVLYERNWTMLVHEQLRLFEGSIVSATRKAAASNNFITSTRAALLNDINAEQMSWSFSEALLYSVTVITTIGHGSLTPKTSAGKIATIIYALIGVPLMLMCLSSLGVLLADALQCTYAKLCCQATRQQDNVNSQRHEGKYQRRCSVDDQLPSVDHADDMQKSTSTTDNYLHKSTLNACDGCKYDAILSSVNPLNDCKYRNENEQENMATHKNYNATEAAMQMQQQTLQVTDADIMLMPTTSTTATATASTQLPQYLPRPMQTIRIAVSQPANSDTSTMTRYVALPSNNCRFILPSVMPHGHVSVAASHRYAHNLTGVTTPTIYFPIPNNSTLPRASFAHTLNRYESISPQQIQPTTAATSTNAIDSYAVPNTPVGLRRTNVLTNPLSPELTTLRKTHTRLSNTNYENAIDSIHNMKNINHNELTTLPTQHTLDCKVTIMEDEEENEQRRLGNCPQGTPSRVPLISAHRNYEQRSVKDLGAKDNSLRNKRGRIGVSFQRHTFNTFQRRNPNGAYAKPQACDMHNGVKRQRRSYCGDLADASDDEEYMQHNSGCYMLKRLDNEVDSADENYNEEAEETADNAERPQIPISIVILLLIAYICLGAVIFAIWENWSLIDGAYFCFVTLTTIGYGDFVPEHILRSADIHLLTFCAYLLIGLILVAMSLSILETQLLWKCKRIAVRLKLVK